MMYIYLLIYILILTLLVVLYKTVSSHANKVLKWFSKSLYKLDYDYTKTVSKRKKEIVKYDINKKLLFQNKINFIKKSDNSLEGYFDFLKGIDEDYELLDDLLIKADLNDDLLKILNDNTWIISFIIRLKKYLYISLNILLFWLPYMFNKLNKI